MRLNKFYPAGISFERELHCHWKWGGRDRSGKVYSEKSSAGRNNDFYVGSLPILFQTTSA